MLKPSHNRDAKRHRHVVGGNFSRCFVRHYCLQYHGIFLLPAFLNEDLDTITAMVRSAAVVRYNPMVAFKWAIIVSIGTMIGFATGFIGFIVVFPILGYATWHAYSDTLAKQTAP